MRMAQRYATARPPGWNLFRRCTGGQGCGSRVRSGPVDYLMRADDLCEESGHAPLALTVLDDAQNARRSLGTSGDATLQRRLGRTIQRRYRTFLARLFESMMRDGQAEELWRLARSRAAHAIEQQAPAILAQCFAWMAAAALRGEKYDLARDNARDAIITARFCRLRFYEGFAHPYLGRRTGEPCSDPPNRWSPGDCTHRGAQHCPDVPLHLEGRQIVSSRAPAVDDGDGKTEIVGHLDEAEA